MSSSNLSGLILGVIFLTLSITMIVNRKSMADTMRQRQRKLFGRFGEYLADQETEKWVVGVGVGMAGLSLLLVFLALFGRLE